MNVASLRQKYPNFVYDKYRIEATKNGLSMTFYYSIPPEIKFKHSVFVPINSPFSILDTQFLHNLVFHLGIVEMLSYWKLTASRQIIIKAGNLNKEQISWWKKLLIKGMGEYFYKNKIDFKEKDFIDFKIEKDSRSEDARSFATRQRRAGFGSAPAGRAHGAKNAASSDSNPEKYLLLFGGGKDSFVAHELLKEAKCKVVHLWINPPENKEIIEKSAGISNPIEINRQIDPLVLELNKGGFLNGHIPYSASLAFISLIVAALTNSRYIVSANEKSSNESNVEYRSEKINHQYSKSFEFEQDFNNYTNKHLTDSVDYFSLVRPLYEIQIAKLFSKTPKYFPVFFSCNRMGKKGKWCGSCAKCLSVFLVLTPFLGIIKTTEIFHKNLLKDKVLLGLFKHIIGEMTPKPFECVATYKESVLAAQMLISKLQNRGEPIPYLLSYFLGNHSPGQKNGKINENKIIRQFDNNHLIPQKLANFVKSKILNF